MPTRHEFDSGDPKRAAAVTTPLAAGADGDAGGLVDAEAPGCLHFPSGEHFALAGSLSIIEDDGRAGHEARLEERECRSAAVLFVGHVRRGPVNDEQVNVGEQRVQRR